MTKPRRQKPRSPAVQTKPSQAKSTQQLRIIGGKWRGRKLSFPAVDGLRPTGDRVRETLFNWLQPVVPGARCLDMYAGSGALGLEALSRGAASVQFIDLDRHAAQHVQAHLQLLDANTKGAVIAGDAIQWLGQTEPGARVFDLVFLDPPFQRDLWQASIAALENSRCLAPEAYIYIEAPVQQILPIPAHWHLHREKQTGNVRFALYCTSAENEQQ